jgi:hypothetical protein
MKETLRRQNFSAISRQISPVSLLDISAGHCRTALVDESEWIEMKWGSTTDQKWSRCKGCLVRQPHGSNDVLVGYNRNDVGCIQVCQRTRNIGYTNKFIYVLKTISP